MKEKDRYKNNSQNNSYAILLQTSKSEADRIQDYDTQFSIIKPMVEDISDEILIAYKKHKQIEIEAAELQKQKLKEQVKYDLHAYENRVLKEKKGGFE